MASTCTNALKTPSAAEKQQCMGTASICSGQWQLPGNLSQCSNVEVNMHFNICEPLWSGAQAKRQPTQQLHERWAGKGSEYP